MFLKLSTSLLAEHEIRGRKNKHWLILMSGKDLRMNIQLYKDVRNHQGNFIKNNFIIEDMFSYILDRDLT